MKGTDLTGIRFEKDGAQWEVLRYHRNGAWICRESKYNTTCEFYRNHIIEALNEAAPWCEPCKSYHSIPKDKAHHEALKRFDKWED